MACIWMPATTFAAASRPTRIHDRGTCCGNGAKAAELRRPCRRVENKPLSLASIRVLLPARSFP